MPLNHQCLPAIAFTLLPNFGFLVGVDLTEDNGRWYSMLEHPSWGVSTGEFYFPLLLMANFCQGYAAFLAWEIGDRNWNTLPLGVYGANLVFLWIHFPIFLGFRSLLGGLVDINLTLISAVGATYLFYEQYDVAGYLMIPYICLLTYDMLRDWWMYVKNRKSPPKDSKTELG